MAEDGTGASRVKKPGKSKPRRKRRGAVQQRGSAAARQSSSLDVAVRSSSGDAGFRRLSAVGLALPVVTSEDRYALALLLMPFLIVATALAGTHAWRTTRAFVPEAAAPVIASRPVVDAIVPPRPMARLPDLPAVLTPPRPEVAPVAQEAPREQLTALFPPEALSWPPPAPAIPPPDPASRSDDGSGFCVAPSPARLASWSPRTSRATLASVPSGEDAAAFGLRIAQAARAQTQDLVIYSARYQAIAYPLGDLNGMYGACTDVVIRAYRAAGVDLQQLVKTSRSGSGDTSIDHRRTETLRRFFARQGAALEISPYPEDYKPGDIVTYYRPFSRVSGAHIAVVSDVLAPTGRPMIVHNRGWGPQLEDALFVDRITGHYRYRAEPTPSPSVTKSVLAQPRAGAPRRAEARMTTMAGGLGPLPR